MPSKIFHLGAKLHYPLTIERVHYKSGDKITRGASILDYSFNYRRTARDDARENARVTTQTIAMTWTSPADGTLAELFVKPGQRLTGDAPCICVEEPCSHELQYQSMCALCGQDMTVISWASTEHDTDRAPINMTHDAPNLTISAAAAQRSATEQQLRLLKMRKLSLVVDLDQTIIHACIEPTIGEWQRDTSNPNHDAVKDVKKFQLADDATRSLASACWYYIKLRPGLLDFLDLMTTMYELHIYTMGTRAYATNIAKLVDPTQKYFGNRILSRDESGSMTAKSLERLFPASTGMVAVIDDRADVWPKNRDNLIKVMPFDFFKGIGDINSSFLPKRQNMTTDVVDISAKGTGVGGAIDSMEPQLTLTDNALLTEANRIPPPANNAESLSDKVDVVSMCPDLQSQAKDQVQDDTEVLDKQRATREQVRLLEKQITERPLLHLQNELDKEDAESKDGSTSVSKPLTERHVLLSAEDHELEYISQHLTSLHTAFYRTYDHRLNACTIATGQPLSTVAESIDPEMVPDVGEVLASLKSKVLKGCVIVLSGLVPLDVDVRRSDIGIQAVSFGAKLHTKVSHRTTHVVVSSARPNTQKARQAMQIPGTCIVSLHWLLDSVRQWKNLPVEGYTVKLSIVEGDVSQGNADPLTAVHCENPGILHRSESTIRNDDGLESHDDGEVESDTGEDETQEPHVSGVTLGADLNSFAGDFKWNDWKNIYDGSSEDEVSSDEEAQLVSTDGNKAKDEHVLEQASEASGSNCLKRKSSTESQDIAANSVDDSNQGRSEKRQRLSNITSKITVGEVEVSTTDTLADDQHYSAIEADLLALLEADDEADVKANSEVDDDEKG